MHFMRSGDSGDFRAWDFTDGKAEGTGPTIRAVLLALLAKLEGGDGAQG